MEKVSSSLAGLAEKSRKRLEFGISPRRKFENANLLAEDFPLFPCLVRRPVYEGAFSAYIVDWSTDVGFLYTW